MSRYSCANGACGKEIPAETIARRHYSAARLTKEICCNRECEGERRRLTGLAKEISVKGKEGRVAFLKRARPHRKKRAL